MIIKSLTLIAAAGIAASGIGAGALVGASSSSASAATTLCQASQLVARYERFNGAAGTPGQCGRGSAT